MEDQASEPDYMYEEPGLSYLAVHIDEKVMIIVNKENGCRVIPLMAFKFASSFCEFGLFVSKEGIEISFDDANLPDYRLIMRRQDQLACISALNRAAHLMRNVGRLSNITMVPMPPPSTAIWRRIVG